MSQFSTIQTAFNTFLTDAAATATAKTNLNTSIAAKPSYPTAIASQSDITTYDTAYASWLTSYNSYLAAYNSAVSTQRAAEIAVLNAMNIGATTAGYDTLSNQWIEVNATGVNYWIGCNPVNLEPDGYPALNYTNVNPVVPYTQYKPA